MYLVVDNCVDVVADVVGDDGVVGVVVVIDDADDEDNAGDVDWNEFG